MEQEIATDVVKSTEDEATWKAHIQYARNFMGTDPEYCRRNGLKLKQFKDYKRKFGFTRPRKQRAKGFLKVECEELLQTDSKKTPRGGPRVALPDAGWTAEFVIALMARR
jgi:hypothetical protein